MLGAETPVTITDQAPEQHYSRCPQRLALAAASIMANRLVVSRRKAVPEQQNCIHFVMLVLMTLL